MLYILIAWLFCFSVIGLTMAMIALRKLRFSGGKFFAGLMLCVSIYAFGYGMELTSTTLAQVLMWIRVEYIGAAFVSPFWLLLAMQYTDLMRRIPFPRWLILFIIPLIVLIAVFTNPMHYQFYRTVALVTTGDFVTLQMSRGIFYWLHVGYVFTTFGVSIVLLSRGLIKRHPVYRHQTGIMMIAATSAALIYLLYQLGVQPFPNLDMIVIALTISSLLLGYGYFKYQLIELPPFARDVLFERLSDAVLVLDARNHLVDYNAAARRFIISPQMAIGVPIPQVLKPPLAQYFDQAPAAPIFFEVIVDEASSEYFEVTIEPLRDELHKTVGRLAVLHNATERIKAENALQQLNEELEQRVIERTAEAQATIEKLGLEILSRREAEAQLKQLQENLINKVTAQSRKLNHLYDVLLYRDQNVDIPTILTGLMKIIREMMQADAICFNEHWKQGQLHLITQVGLSEEQVHHLNLLPEGWERVDFPLLITSLAEAENLPGELRKTGYSTCLIAPVNLNRQYLGVILAFWELSKPVSVEDISMFAIIAEHLGIILENARLREAIGEQAAMVERRRLARDLHDSVTQSLHSLLLNTEVLKNRIESGRYDRTLEMINRIDVNTRQALKEIRLMLYELRLTPLEEVHLVEALQTRIEAVEQKAGIEAKIVVGEPAEWPAVWEVELYPIAMEALNNSLKHAQATQVEVCIRGGSNWAVMEVMDNGKGFDRQDTQPRGLGMHTMRERAEHLGGRLEVRSNIGEGTCIRVIVGQEKSNGVNKEQG